MNSGDIKLYVIEKLKEGLNVNQVRGALSDLGRTKDEIDEIFKEEEIRVLILGNEGIPPPPPPFVGGDKEENLSESGNKSTLKIDSRQNGHISDIDFVPSFKKESDDKTGVLPDIEFYVYNSLRQGFSKETIRRVAATAGWPVEEVDKALR